VVRANQHYNGISILLAIVCLFVGRGGREGFFITGSKIAMIATCLFRCNLSMSGGEDLLTPTPLFRPQELRLILRERL